MLIGALLFSAVGLAAVFGDALYGKVPVPIMGAIVLATPVMYFVVEGSTAAAVILGLLGVAAYVAGLGLRGHLAQETARSENDFFNALDDATRP